MIRLRRAAVLLAVAAALLVVSQLVLPRTVETRIEKELQSALPGARFVRASVEASPGLKLLAGRIDEVDLDLRRVPLGDLVVDALLVDGRGLIVDVPRLVQGRGVEIKEAEELRATLVIAEADLNEYFWSQVHEARFFRVSLDKGRALLTGEVNLLGRSLEVYVSGVFRVEGPASVAFIPEEVSLQNARLPEALLDLITQEWAVVLDIGKTPFDLALDELHIEDGQLLIYASRPPEVS